MIILVTGSQGSGKTVFLTKYAYNAYQKGEKVYSNFKLNFPHEEMDFDKMMNCEYSNATIVITEAHNWGLDARDAMREPNKSLVKMFIPQIRKQGVTLIVDTQRWNGIDKRLRLNCDVLVMCKKRALINNKWQDVMQSHQYSRDTPISIEADFTFLDTERTKTLLFLANPYYRLYDTTEAIKTIEQAKGYKDEKTKKTNKKKVKSKK